MSKMLLDAHEILRIRRAGTAMLETATKDAQRGQWLLAQMHAKTAVDILQAAGMLMNGVSKGFDILAQPHVRHAVERGARDARRGKRA